MTSTTKSDIDAAELALTKTLDSFGMANQETTLNISSNKFHNPQPLPHATSLVCKLAVQWL